MTLNKRIPAWLIFLIVLLMIGSSVMASETNYAQKPDDNNTLVLLNWSEYIDPEVLNDFKIKFGIEVKEIYYETDEIRTEMLINTSGQGFDLALVNGPSISQYAKRDWLYQIPIEDLPNLKHVKPKWQQAFPDSEKYAVPLMWGTLGIVYRSDKITTPVTSWMDLFKPAESLKGKIVMIKDSRDLVGMSLKALGYSANTTEKDELEQAKQLLLNQKPFVKTYSYIALTQKSSLVTGNTWMAMAYNGDALMLQEFDEKITFVNPTEGGNLWCDYLTILKSSNKKKAAVQFINFIHEPKIMARLAQFAYYATTNSASEKLLPQEFLKDPVIYPPTEVIQKSESYQQLPPRVVKKYNSIFSLVSQ